MHLTLSLQELTQCILIAASSTFHFPPQLVYALRVHVSITFFYASTAFEACASTHVQYFYARKRCWSNPEQWGAQKRVETW